MGRARTEPNDKVFEARRIRYIQTRGLALEKAKIRYKEDRPAILAAMKAGRDAAREARLLAKSRAFYEAHPALAKDDYGLAREFVRNYKAGKPCLDCGQSYPYYIMEFDHVYGVKRRNISDLTTIASIRLEIPKCELVCANCHRERTFKRRNLN